MVISKLRRFGPRGSAIGILVGFALFLIGAQLPYEEICPPFRGRDCFARTYLDLTPTRASDGWSVTFWYGQLGAVLVAVVLTLRSGVHRRRAAGFVAFFSVMLAGEYLATTMPLAPRVSWLPGAALWPLGALVMFVAALRLREPEQLPSPAAPTNVRTPLILMVSGALLVGVATILEEDLGGYLFAFGGVVFVGGALMLRGRTETGGHPWRRVLGLPLAFAGVLLALTFFVPLVDEATYPAIQAEFVLHPRRMDFWNIFSLIAWVAAPLAGAADLAVRSRLRPFLLGGLVFIAYWLSGSIIVTLTGAGPYSTQWGQGVAYALVALILMWPSALFLAMNEQQA